MGYYFYDIGKGEPFDFKDIVLDTARDFGLLIHLRDKGRIEPKLENYLNKYRTEEKKLSDIKNEEENIVRYVKELKIWESYNKKEINKIIADKISELEKNKRNYCENQKKAIDNYSKFESELSKWECPKELKFVLDGINERLKTARDEDCTKTFYDDKYLEELQNTDWETFKRYELAFIHNCIKNSKTRVKELRKQIVKDNTNELITKLFESLDLIKEDKNENC